MDIVYKKGAINHANALFRRRDLKGSLKLKLKLFTTCAGKLDRLLSHGPLYFATHDLLASWSRVSPTRYMSYRYAYLQCVSTFLGSYKTVSNRSNCHSPPPKQ
jgi:hypothetical protein